MRKLLEDVFGINRRRGGFAMLLGLLIAVVFGMIVYYFQFIGPGIDLGTGGKLDNPPWQEWEKLSRRIDKGKVGDFTGDHPLIEKPLGLKVNINDGERGRRGQILLLFSHEGKVEGEWTGNYYWETQVEHDVMMGQSEGVFDPDKVYMDENGMEDYSKVYFLTRGHFSILENNYDSGKVRNIMGNVFVSGWLGEDDIVEGHLTLKSGAREFWRFKFSGKVKPYEDIFMQMLGGR